MSAPVLFLDQDAKLLDRIRRGDEEALATLYRSNQRAVTALITRNSGSTDDAADVLQESLVILWERVRSGRYEHTARLDTFLFATARNLWLRRLARLRRETPAEINPEHHPSDDPSPLEELIESERARLVKLALTKLGEPCRTLLILFYWEEISMEEIASRLGLANADTAKTRKYQCKKALQLLLRDIAPDYD
jgi:RNA polymerase sigma factor (sigma-70 family)